MELNHHMHIIIYSSTKDDHFEKIQKEVVGNLSSGISVQYLNSCKELSLSLTDSVMGSTIFLIFLHDLAELSKISKLKKRLNDFKSTILILPDTDLMTLRAGLQLYPRYVTCAKEDYKDVSIVINNMISNYHHTATFSKSL